MTDDGGLVAEVRDGCWRLGGFGAAGFELVNDYLAYLADWNYSPRTVRAYAFDLLHFCRWLAGDGVGLDAVTTEVMLRFLASCREAATARRQGGNVYSIVGGRNAGDAPATVNRRWPRCRGYSRSGRCAILTRRCRCRAGGKPAGPGAAPDPGCWGTRPKPRSGLRVREPRRLPRGLDATEVAALVGSLRTWRDRGIAGLMLYSGLRSAEVLGLNVRDVDIGGRWVRVTGKGDKERRVPLDTEVAGVIQAYLLAERPATSSARLFVVAKGPNRGQPLTPGRVADGVPLSPAADRGSGGSPARVAPHVRHGIGSRQCCIECNTGRHSAGCVAAWRAGHGILMAGFCNARGCRDTPCDLRSRMPVASDARLWHPVMLPPVPR